MNIIILFGLTLVGLSNCMNLPFRGGSMCPKSQMVKTISNAFVDRLVKEARNADFPQIMETLLPPFDETHIVDPFLLPLNIAFDIEGTNVTIVGELELTSEGQIVGLGEIYDDFNLVIIPFLPPTVEWDLKIPSVSFNGEYRMDMDLSLGSDPHKIIGEGEMTSSVTDVFVYMVVTLKATGFLDVTKLELDLGFKNLQLDGGEATIDEIELDWNYQSENFQTFFDTLWTNNPEVKEIVTEAARCSVGSIIKNCALLDLVGGNTDCISDIDLICLEPLLPLPWTPDPIQESTTSDVVTSTPRISTEGPVTFPEVTTTEEQGPITFPEFP